MALQVKALATKSDHLSSVPGTHMVEGKKQNKNPHARWHMLLISTLKKQLGRPRELEASLVYGY